MIDDEWHRLHPLTPLLRGGLVLIAILGILFAQLRERIVGAFVGEPSEFHSGDPIDLVLRNGLVPAVLGGAGLFVVLLVLLGWVAWRAHEYRLTDEVIEVRRGVLQRRHRRARLDRVQAVNIRRQLVPRLFGCARLEVQTAGSDGGFELSYLGSRQADALRAEILRRASGLRARAAEASGGAGSVSASAQAGLGERIAGHLERTAQEFIAPELDPSLAPPQSVVRMHPGRLVGSLVLGGSTLWFLALVAGLTVVTIWSKQLVTLFAMVPLLFAFAQDFVRRTSRSLRYSIAATPDGIRIGYGLLATSNETLPPGRIHAIGVMQPLAWRPFGWWSIDLNRAAHAHGERENHRETTVLPVGNRQDVLRVLALLLPELAPAELERLALAGLGRASALGPDDLFTVSPPRARVLRLLSRRRNGVFVGERVLAFRRGAISRHLVLVPTARLQSVAIHQGPMLRALRLAALRVHSVRGRVRCHVGALDAADAQRAFVDAAAVGIAAAAADRSHRWAGSAA